MAESNNTREPRYDGLWPLGHRATEQATLSPRLDSLDCKRVGFVWNHVFKGDRMFRVFEEVIRDRYENVVFVDHRTFGNIHGTAAEEHEAVELLPQRLQELEVDAVIVGVGA